MPRRRAALIAVLAAVAAFSGGVAMAATHGSPHKLQPPKLLPMKQPVANTHLRRHYCHKNSAISASL